MDSFFIVTSLLKIVGILFVVILPMVSYSVYAERRVSAFIQDRPGPNRVGPAGLLQPIADMFKLLLKEDFTPRNVNTFYYWLAPCLAMMPAIITIAVVPFGSTLFGVPMVIADVNVGILFVFAIASLGVYGIVIAGWASNSKYPFLGGIRSSSQMISYELSLGLAVIPVFLLVGNLRLTSVVQYQIEHGWFIAPFVGDWVNLWKWLLAIPMIISFAVFMIAIFAETNRLPFDLPEAEQELAGGYHTEYSSMKFALFFLGEYAAMITGSAIIVTLFFGGWHFPGIPDEQLCLHTSLCDFPLCPANGAGSKIDPCHLPASVGECHDVCSGTAANVDGAAGLMRFDEIKKFGRTDACIPRGSSEPIPMLKR